MGSERPWGKTPPGVFSRTQEPTRYEGEYDESHVTYVRYPTGYFWINMTGRNHKTPPQVRGIPHREDQGEGSVDQLHAALVQGGRSCGLAGASNKRLRTMWLASGWLPSLLVQASSSFRLFRWAGSLSIATASRAQPLVGRGKERQLH